MVLISTFLLPATLIRRRPAGHLDRAAAVSGSPRALGRGAFGSVIRGDVSLAFAKRYHPGWYREIVGSTEPTK